MFGAFVTQILVVKLAEEYTRGLGQAGFAHFIGIGPARRAVGGDSACLSRPPDRHADGHHQCQQAAAGGDGAADVENVRRIGIEDEPPLEQTPGVIHRRTQQLKPGRPQASLIAERGSRPLRGTPHSGQGDGQHHQHLAVQHRCHMHP
ncbi:hypothetical protein D9M70_295360 [compost metagenome]